ncbi:MAG TPA: translation elongation factor Ts [Candidatus Paceibacterota bacterium]|jgi:elongation factor Ts|nr:translation elongation factor Ts [Candidatus Paceibacterota bacterium]HPT40067.1 translation elongation factor Ts [Candidatus Paceibacterota bacterium]
MDINIVKQLREETGASVMECNNALDESKGDLEKAKEILKRKGQATALKKSGRETKSGLIESYIHASGKVGVLLDLRCETDFVAKNDLFKELSHEICLQIAAMSPEFVSEDDISEEFKTKEREISKEEMKDSGKPEKIVEQIIEGKLKKRFAELCLLNQAYIKDPSQTIADLIKGYISKTGENIKVLRFSRFEI